MINPFESNLFIQGLAAAAGALGGQNSVGAALGNVANQSIQSQNYAKLLKQLLGPDGSKGTFDSSGITLKIPPTNPMVSSLLGGENTLTPDNTLTSQSAVSNVDQNLPPVNLQSGGRPTIINPFVSDQQATTMPNLNASDLAGLSPEMIASAFGVAHTVKGNPIEDAYKRAAIAHMNAQTENIPIQTQIEMMKAAREKRDALDELSPFAGPGGTPLTNRQFSELPEKDRSYLVAKHGAKMLGDEKFMSQREWEATAPTQQALFLKELMANPKMKALEFALKRAGATNISLDTKIAEKKAMGDLSGQLYFGSPDWTKDLDKHMSSNEVMDAMDSVPRKGLTSDQYKQQVGTVKAKEKVKFIEDKITGGGGKIQSVKLGPDGKTMIWNVQWPSGDNKELRYIVK